MKILSRYVFREILTSSFIATALATFVIFLKGIDKLFELLVHSARGGEQVAADQEVVVTRFAPVKAGQSVRLRLSETYTAPESYRLQGDEFAFERSLGRSRNSVVLPRGWYLTWLSIPAVVRQTPDGLTRVDFVNGRPDSIDVLMKGKRLATAR